MLINNINRWNQAEDELASLLHLTITRPLPTVVTVGGVIDVSYLLDMPHGFTWKGVYVDADVRTVEAVRSSEWGVGSEGEREKLFMKLSSLQGSILENKIFEDDFQVESISTAKLFQLIHEPSAMSHELITIDKTNIDAVLPTLSVDDNIKKDITNSVNQNLAIRIPQSEITYYDWTGIGYLKENPQTGESGWMLSGMIAGGMTAWDVTRWNDIVAETLSSPYTEPPNYDPASARYIQKVTATDMETGTVGVQLAQPLQVKVFDQAMNGVENVVVTFAIKAGGGTLTSGIVSSPTVTAKTNNQGIASVTLALGKYTRDNPNFLWDEGYTYAMQVGENIVDASLPSGVGLTVPFTALGVPKAAHHMKAVHGDGTWSAALSYAGFVAVTVEDEYNNPISNVPVTFTAADPTQNPDTPNCTWTSQDSRKTYFTEASLACLKDAPTWGSCGDTLMSSLTITSDHTGAAAPVILGGMEDAIYAVNASTPNNLNANFKLYTYDLHALYNRPCDNTEDPLRQLFVAYTYPSDRQGNSINAGKAGTTIPVQAKLYSLVEGETTKDVSISCGSGTLTCSKIVGTRQYSTTIDFTSASVTFSGTSGTAQGNGVYTANYTLQPGLNTIAVNGTATLNVNSTKMVCPSTCDSVTVPLTQTDSTTMQVYGVDIILQDPGPVFVDENDYSLNNLVAQYTITPAEYKANTAYVMILKNGEPVAYVSSEKTGSGSGTFLKGFQFDMNSVYEAQVILNYGSGVEIRSEKKRISLHRVELVDANDNPVTAAQIGEYENFVSWKTLEVKYKITPALSDNEYAWQVAGGTATRTGHPGLGTPAPQSTAIDKANRLIKFMPGSTGSTTNVTTAQKSMKARPLAFDLRFKLGSQIVKTFTIQQNDQNALRQEYKAAGATVLPEHTDFSGGALDGNIPEDSPYSRDDIPRVTKLHNMRDTLNTLVPNKYSITSSYRNPYLNLGTSTTGINSRHVWSGALDVKDSKNYSGTNELKTVWDRAKTNPAVFGFILVEADKTMLEEAVRNYIKTSLLPDGSTSTIYSVKLKSISSHSTLDLTQPNVGSYMIVWSSSTNTWGKVKFIWEELLSDNETIIAHDNNGTDLEYQLTTSNDWSFVARNLHLADKAGQEGF